MKDSQPYMMHAAPSSKYIKVNNERFSTAEGSMPKGV